MFLSGTDTEIYKFMTDLKQHLDSLKKGGEFPEYDSLKVSAIESAYTGIKKKEDVNPTPASDDIRGYVHDFAKEQGFRTEHFDGSVFVLLDHKNYEVHTILKDREMIVYLKVLSD